MKKILSILGAFSIAASSSSTVVSCTSPYRYWSAFENKIKNSETFLVYYHVKDDPGSISYESDIKFTDNGVNYYDSKMKSIYNEYLTNLSIHSTSPKDLTDNDDYRLNGYGNISSSKKIDKLEWTVDSAKDMFAEWWSKKVWGWIRQSLIENYYYYNFEKNNIKTKIAYNIAVSYVSTYLNSSLPVTPTNSPVFFLVRGGKFLNFVPYHTSKDADDKNKPDAPKIKDTANYNTQQERIDDFTKSIKESFVDDQQYSQTLISAIDKANAGSNKGGGDTPAPSPKN
ncbi:lipoprotein [Spiroplasma endosymbiont of Aspidapion aeneum]|uniref:lipoprotein n=1 Tax=Spiroplasma endosymbiont of Aspidapion aeneum TaxID=3066276 RepID=UPI00313AD361